MTTRKMLETDAKIRKFVTKSRSGHYTVTIRVGRFVEFTQGKIADLITANRIAKEQIEAIKAAC